jgi:MFS family permease
VTDAGVEAEQPALFRLICGFICVHACMAGVRMTSPLLALQLGYSAAAVGVMLALFALTQVFLSLPAGRYVDKHGLKRPVGLSVVAASLGTVNKSGVTVGSPSNTSSPAAAMV